MAKIRVYDLAKELGKSSKEVVGLLLSMGMEVKNHMSTIEESQADWVKKELSKKTREGKAASRAATEKQAAQPQESREDKKEVPPKSEPRRQERTGRPLPSAQEKSPATTKAPRPQTAPPRQAHDREQGREGKSDRPQRPPSTDRTQHPSSTDRTQRPSTSDRPQRPPTADRAQRPPTADRTQRPPTADRTQRPPAADRTQRPQTTGRPSRPPATDRPQTADRPHRRPGGSSAQTAAHSQQHPARTEAAGKPGAKKPEAPKSTEKGDFKGKKPFHQQPGKKGLDSAAPRKDYSRPKKTKHKRKKEETVQQTPELIVVGDTIMVRELAEKLAKGAGEIVKKLMDLGTMASINQVIDFETAEILASLYEVRVEKEITREEIILEEIIDSEADLVTRPPVVTVMGHVDHGKTSLLDRIRQADVVSGEAGGITQHIGAYQVKIKGSRITFIDTPGHEAFTAMRARGANLTDIVVLVVAADDGVMPQTVEAINHIKAAGVPFIVAINKIDKPEANPDRIMQQLTEYNIVPEEWGGDIIFAPVSAKSGDGIENLLEIILLVAEVNEIKANVDRAAEGVIIEGELDKGKGAVATVLVQKGTLNVGDFLICGYNLCKVRAMTDDRGRKVEKAYPSMPVEVTGWDEVPEAGMKIQAVDEKVAKEIIGLRLTDKKIAEQRQSSRVSLDDFFKQIQDAEVKELGLIIKGDVQGSVEALAQSLLRLSTNEVKVNVIHSAVGAVTETDVMLASASNAIILGFNVRPDSNARKYAEDEQIDVRLYRVIYEAIEDVKRAMVGLLDPEYKEKYLGRAEVRMTFKVPSVGTVGGSYVIDGKIQRNAEVRVLRDGVIVYEGKLASLKRFKDDVKEVLENYECGMGIKDFNDIKEGDIIEAYVMEEIPREL
ncbi:MAG: translation initiation factor IF-2 [Syntrophomonadaceae bacterium]|jgi:translation initiation factor IF-2|nr:translation initiation factor IF-2 [Syntrophomonadaceae bacterium]